jgi:alkaline phosphatase D
MNVFNPSVGPLIGHTTPTQTRIFLRGRSSQKGHCYGFVRYRRRGELSWAPAVINRVDPARDMTTVLVINALVPDTEYQYQAGYLIHPGSLAEVQALDPEGFAWPADHTTHLFKTSAATFGTPRRYLIGSCRYLNLTANVPLDIAFSDSIFKPMLDYVESARPAVDAFVMTGDQIYADDWNFLAPDRLLSEFLVKYQHAFTTPNFHRLASRIPCYMILDDHEIEDNWPQRATVEKRRTLLPNALEAYTIYQCSHSPLFGTSGTHVTTKPAHFWYTFGHGDVEWFVLDVRTERTLQGEPRTLGDAQMAALLEWLGGSEARVKFVVTSVMLYPDARNPSSGADAWQGFPAEREQILEHIRLNQIRNVIFITGDVHCSLTCELRHADDPDFSVHTIVASPLSKHRLLPNNDTGYFELEKPLSGSRYYPHLSSAVISQENFAALRVEQDHVAVNYVGKQGQALSGEIRIGLR